MKMAILLFILLSASAWSKVTLELQLPADSVKQGEIVYGKLIVKESQGQAALSGLKGKKISKTLYLLNLSPFMGKQGVLESEAKVIFMAVPESNYIMENINGEEVAVSWNNLEVRPTEEPQSFLLGDFEVPERKEIFPWLVGLFGLAALSILGLWLRNKFRSKKLSKSLLHKTKDEILNCQSYDDVVLMWRQKRAYLQKFPQLESAFLTLEKTLFKYQFKQQRTAREEDEVLVAYNSFKTEVQGVLNGI